jgi:hypothetical protein
MDTEQGPGTPHVESIPDKEPHVIAEAPKKNESTK